MVKRLGLEKPPLKVRKQEPPFEISKKVSVMGPSLIGKFP